MRALVLGLLCLLLATLSFAQSTTVSGTITDASSQAWNYGTYSFVFKPANSNPVGPYFWNGAPFSTAQTIQGNLSPTATFSVSVPSSTSITPAGSTWTMQLCPAATAQCFTTPLTVTGATQSVSSIIPPAISVNLANPPAGASAYADSEIVGQKAGSFYFNLTDSTLHFYTLTGVWISNFAAGPSTIPVGYVIPGTNGQCAITSGGVSVWGSCPGMQLQGGVNTSTVTVNTATTSVQILGQPTCSSAPCIAAGVMNTVGKTFDFYAAGTFSFANNTGESIGIWISFSNSSTSATPNVYGGWTQLGPQYWSISGTCTTVTTGASGQAFCAIATFIVDGNGGLHSYPNDTFAFATLNMTNAFSPTVLAGFSTSSTSNTLSQTYAYTHLQN